MKKLVSILVALMLVLAMFSVATAQEVLVNGIAGESDDSALMKEDTVLILKELKVYNTTGEDIYLPTVGYDYTITAPAVAAGTTVTDTHDHEGFVYTGNLAALDSTSKSVDFSPSFTAGYTAAGASQTLTQPVTAAASGTSYYGGFTVTVDPDVLGHAGIWRYQITEAEDATNTLAKAGVVHQDATAYEAVRYLDVYVRQDVNDDDNDNSTDDFIVYGYVLWTPDSQSEDTSITNTPNVTKENGYVTAHGGDKYNTWNLIVTKDITGTLADTTHQFPFQVVLTSPNATAAQIYYSATDGIPTTDTTAQLSSASALTLGTLTSASTVKLTDDGILTIYGIPAGVTATVQENNDTYDTYTASATITAATAQTYTENQVASGANATIITGVDNATTTTVLGAADSRTDWENEIAIVSPTGYMARFAPYALILIAGIALMIVAGKKRAKNED